MNKKILVAIASTLALGAIAVPGAMAQGMMMTQSTGNWAGPYAGAKLGFNNAKAQGFSDENAWTTGLEVGQNWNMGGPVIGVDGFIDFNGKETHNGAFPLRYGSRTYGVEGRLGVDLGPLMPYGKLGFANTDLTGDASGNGWGLRGGLGVEYKMMPNIGVTGEWNYSRADIGLGNTEFKNNNFTVGVNYHFQ